MEPIPRVRALLPLLLAAVIVLVVDAFVFGPSGPYVSRTKPESYAGKVAAIVQAETGRPPDPARDVLVLGDSRIKLGFDTRIAGSVPAAADLEFRVAAIEGSRQRSWYYLLRRLDPRADRYAAVVVPVLEYSDRDVRYTGGIDTTNPAQAPADLRTLLPLVHPWDAPRILTGFEGTQNLDLALRIVFLKGLAYREDLVEYVRHPDRRERAVERMHDTYERSMERAAGRRASLRGIERFITEDGIDWPARARLKDLPKERLEQVIEGGVVDSTGNRARYHADWLGGIARRYADSDTRVVLMPLPRSPLLRDEDRPTVTSGLPARLADAGMLHLMDETPARALESPEMFADHIHLNVVGMQRYSAYAASEVARILDREGGR